MMSLYSGTPGSGKSLHMASRLCNRYRYINAPTVCNFDCDFSQFKNHKGQFVYCDNSELTPRFLMKFSMDYSEKIGRKPKEGEILLVIDEAQLLFNARDWGRNDRSEWCAFFTQHRKFGYDIVLIAQFDRMLDRQVRNLIEYEFIHRKVSNFGLQGKLLSLVALGKLFVAVKVWYPMKEKVGSEFFVFSKKYNSIYNTFALFSAPKENF